MNSISLFYLVSELSAECAGKQTTSATRKINIIIAKKMHLEKCAGFMADGEGLLMSSDILRVLFDLTLSETLNALKATCQPYRE